MPSFFSEPRFIIDICFRLIGVVLFVVGVIQARRILKKLKDRHGRLPAVFDLAHPNQRIPGSRFLEKNFRGMTFQLEHNLGKGDFGPHLVISVLEKLPGEFFVGHLGYTGLWRKIIKRVSAVRTGDGEFDRQYDIITGSTPGYAAKCFQSPDVRRPAERLFEMGFSGIRNDRKGIDAIWAGCPLLEEIDDSLLERTLGRVRELVLGVRTVEPTRVFGVEADGIKFTLGLLVPFLLFFLTFPPLFGLWGKPSTVGADELSIYALRFSVPLCVLSFPLLLWLVRGRTNSHLVFLGIWLATCLILYLGAGTWVHAFNISLDKGPAEKHVQFIFSVDTNQRKTAYFAHIDSWRPDEFSREVPVEEEDYATILRGFEEGQWVYLELDVMPGYFGFEWVASSRPVDATGAKEILIAMGKIVKLEDIHLRDPFILPDSEEDGYYLFGTNFPLPDGPGFAVYWSEDLEYWRGPEAAFRRPEGFWATKDFWAPEVHPYDDACYMFASFKADDVPRASQILASYDDPEGPYQPHSDGPVTPSDWECLDGTLFVDDEGQPWIVFCHEWVQVGDGEICALRLENDLSASVGDPALLFRASEAPWVVPFEQDGRKCYVTDGPFLHRMEDGMLIMLWSSFGKGGYTLGIARSESGGILGPWRQEPEPLYVNDGGHGMLFRTFQGHLILALHQPNQGPLERPRLLPIEEREGNLTISTKRR